ncbi:hypothetical protein [Nocardia cerradoensis]|uniref:Uncharacterized protein n=1 Tax=Nocardia cerradoensis TaxID=85688 RepID=A0A231H2R8_9NOCA|nr:hypothetical protein [Nocardia cerradoensis]NKY43540.1 hypothetical protein [Nocardia cerradoensis]OXR43117.1 hypothetical protein B7C42_05003 [Nocardia cerradoensis]
MTESQRDEVANVASAVSRCLSDLEPVFEQIDWAEDEIARAQQRHTRHRNTVYHSFALLMPTHERMRQEFVYRSHCRELLDRVAAGLSPVYGTAAEVALTVMEASQKAPLNTAAFGLYVRMWIQAGFPHVESVTGSHEHYEAIAKSRIDDLEAETRTRLSVADRVLRAIDCPGRHHGQPADDCQYARPSLAA